MSRFLDTHPKKFALTNGAKERRRERNLQDIIIWGVTQTITKLQTPLTIYKNQS